MKKVRFKTPSKLVMNTMQEYGECHSPRPFIERQIVEVQCNVDQGRPVVFTNDPVHRFENDNSSPYPIANKTYLGMIQKEENRGVPSSDLDLSMLDYSKPRSSISPPKISTEFRTEPDIVKSRKSSPQVLPSRNFLTSIENTPGVPVHNIIRKDNGFFLKREHFGEKKLDTMHQHFDQFSSNENNPEFLKMNTKTAEKENYAPTTVNFNTDCICHHCINILNHNPHNVIQNSNRNMEHLYRHIPKINYSVQGCVPSPRCSCNCNMPIVPPTCKCNNPPNSLLSPQNAIDKKTWAIEKYEKTQGAESSVEKSNIVLKEKREPTVSDLFKIIKLQNEQLQLLQEKVDKFISTHNHDMKEKQNVPIQNYMTEQLAVQTVNSEQHKISIGVMTSFEMVRTSTVINKEIVKQCEAQIQCNRSQISIKEVVSKKQAGNLNFLEGISPVSKNTDLMKGRIEQAASNNDGYHVDNILEDKTLNEMSLYNVQVDNATTPLMSPEQSLYLDIRDYSESDSGSDDQSNVGWTYYNKVMTHVNGMLQDSDMPSSASALYRHTKQKCMQMQTDKSNVSVGKRVTFGDNPLGIKQHHINTPTDTSLKMNQLAEKYLKHVPTTQTPSPKAGEMSFATKNYMERHRLVQGPNAPIQQDIPRFLDITALKQQPKFI